MKTNKPFQRKGSESNSKVGKDFEMNVKACFEKNEKGLILNHNVSLPIGINGKKTHNFDLGNLEKRVIVECKSHKWTEGGNVPSAKMTTWNQAMYFFYAAPRRYRKIFMVLRDRSDKNGETLAEYYLRTNSHLIPNDVEIWECDEDGTNEKRLKWH